MSVDFQRGDISDFSESRRNISAELMDIDKELEELLNIQTSKIKVIGVGGGGNNTLSRIHDIGVKGG